MIFEPKVDAVAVRLVRDELANKDVDVDAALKEAGLTTREIEDEGNRVPVIKQIRLCQIAARLLDDDCFGLRIGASVNAKELGLVSYIGLSSETVGEGIENLARYIKIFTDRVKLQINSSGNLVEIMPETFYPHNDLTRQLNEASLSHLVATYRTYTNHPIKPDAVHFRHERSSNRRKFEKFFGCPTYFGSDRFGVILKEADLNLPLTTADSLLLNLLRKYGEELLAKLSNNEPQFLREVNRHIIKQMPKGGARAKVVAEEMGISERTFSRRLAQSGTSFQEILDKVRSDISIRYLQDTNLSLTQIAFLLGYSEPAAFNHAFKRWTGRSPRDTRMAAIHQ